MKKAIMQNKRNRKSVPAVMGLSLLLLLGTWLLHPGSLFAAIPNLLTYQGILKNDSGSYLTGTYSMTFKIYNVSTGGTALWTETHSSVSVSSGQFSVELGSTEALTLDFDAQYYLGITVGGDSEMTPRVKLTSVGYAYNAEDVENSFTQDQHNGLAHMNVEGVKANTTNLAKTNFKLDAYSTASANNMGDMIVDVFSDASGIEDGSSSGYEWRGSPDYDVVTNSGGIDSYTVLMLHTNGSDTSTTFTDDSDSAHSATANGNAQIDTAQSKFSGASGLFDGSGDYLSIPDSTGWDFGTGDFTIDFWVRFNSISGTQENTIYSNGNSAADDGTVNVYYFSNQLRIRVYVENQYTWTASTGTWYHVAIARESGTITAYVDGSALTVASNQGVGAKSISNSQSVQIGQRHGGGNHIDGWIDELRVSKGIARWTSNFTPPSSEYSAPSSSATVISKKFVEPVVPAEAMIIPSETLNTGSITYYISRDDGTNWTQATKETVIDISGQPSDSDMRWKAVINGDAELEAMSLAV